MTMFQRNTEWEMTIQCFELYGDEVEESERETGIMKCKRNGKYKFSYSLPYSSRPITKFKYFNADEMKFYTRKGSDHGAKVISCFKVV